jgi:short subunit dehydrogenase-like uncharacterized protein
VVNTIGPFAQTMLPVVRACSPGTHYVDLTNELPAVTALLDLHDEAVETNRTLVTGAGFGVLATESVVLSLCAGRPPAERVRVDALASVVSEPGTTVSGPTGKLEAARRASGGSSVVAASSLFPAGPLIRVGLPIATAALRIPPLRGAVTGRIARTPTTTRARPREHSWAHARVRWSSGEVREGWLRAGEGMEFTAAVAAGVAGRPARGEGKPGAHTPGALFGPERASDAGGEFLLR